jgi:hypothetical protein
MFADLWKWFGRKKTKPGNDCPECERLNREEAEASIELVAADVSIMADERARSRSMAAEGRFRAARERLAAHRELNHPQDYKGAFKTTAKNPSPGSRPGSLCIVSTTLAPDIAATS